MGASLSQYDKALYRAVDEVLHYVWDPVGISGIPRARDEYQSYLPQVFGMLREGGNEQAIASFLNSVAAHRMGLNANPKRNLEVASLLVEWRQQLSSRYA